MGNSLLNHFSEGNKAFIIPDTAILLDKQEFIPENIVNMEVKLKSSRINNVGNIELIFELLEEDTQKFLFKTISGSNFSSLPDVGETIQIGLDVKAIIPLPEYHLL